jgi:galactofuranosylgalactofuranosylrhamnosyl-N-acetylglucosaminyl-diphospho-decaprenol beta-1,5/1,6-galactofuranosyltransferase
MSITLQRVVLPASADTTVLPLYVDGPPYPEVVGGRRSVRVPARERVSLAGYLNAFPAAYWQHATAVEQVRLSMIVDGPVAVEVFRTDGSGRARRYRREVASSAGEVAIVLPMDGFDDGGWYWFDVVAGDTGVEVRDAVWTTDREARASASVGITTFNRVADCCALLEQLSTEPDLLALLDRVYVVDQSDDHVASTSAFAAPASALGDRLRVIEQANLGGSGGFARCQLETLRAGESDFVLLLDDDIRVDPELLRRMIVFGALCRRPTLVGAPMLSASRPTRLHAAGERVLRRRFWWTPVDPEHRDHDLATTGLRDAPWLHRLQKVDYNGWWGCLIPVSVLAEIGLALPLFIKWDDAEYGLRAAAAGHPTVTLPGAGVWHVTWADKNDAVDWQAYFHQRNRVIAALLHSPYPNGGALVPELMAHQVKHLAAMQYSAAELRRRAVLDVLAGPDLLHATLDTVVTSVREIQNGFSDGRRGEPVPHLPTAGSTDSRPSRPALVAGAAGGVVRQLLPTPAPADRAASAPEVVLRHEDAYWWRLLSHDSAVVSTADGTGSVHYRRDRRTFIEMLRRNARVHRRLHREWPELAVRYRAALPRLTSPGAWEETFERVGRHA